ncbi:MAG: RidA family protein [Trueperaceae bacterium]
MRSIVSSDRAPAALGPYSQAVRVGNLLFTSGQVALTPDGAMVEGDVRAQAAQVMANLRAVLEAAGTGFEHVVKSTCFLRDMNDFTAFNEVYGGFFPVDPPARSTVQVARLPKDAAVEVELVALVP